MGSDYVFPRTANEIIKAQVKELGGEIVGEEYIPLGSKNVEPIIKQIVSTHPTIIINTINGDSNIPFFQVLRAYGITTDKTPTLSFSIAENELQSLNISQMAGDYAAWNYFQSIPSLSNQKFVKNFKEKYGNFRVTDDPVEAAYFGVYIWAQAVSDANTDEVNKVKQSIKRQSFIAPEGPVYVDPDNQHIWKQVRIGKIRHDGQFDIVWRSEKPIKPIPYPPSRSKEEWERFLDSLYKRWNNNWANGEKK